MYRYDSYTSAEIEKAIKNKKNILVPLGAIEAHSDHLPLSTDNDIATGYVMDLAERTDSLYLPVLPYGQVWSLQYAPGSIHIEEDVLVNLLYSILESLSFQGAEMVTFVLTHFGNINAAKAAARRAFGVLPIKVLYITYPGLEEAKLVFDNLSNHSLYLHADEIETSFMLHYYPEKVHLEKIKDGMIAVPIEQSYTPMRWTEFSDTYIIGDARKATNDKGKLAMEKILAKAAELILKEKRKLEKI